MNDSLSASLKRIAWGWILLHCNFNFGTLNILPDWLGYIMILNGLAAVSKTVRSASLLYSFGIGLALWDFAGWFFALFGASIPGIWLSLFAAVVGLYFRFQLLTDLASLADAWNCEQGNSLRKLRTIETIATTVLQMTISGKHSYTLVELLDETFWGYLFVIVLLVGFIATVCIAHQLFSLQKDIAYYTEPQPIPISSYTQPEEKPQEPDDPTE